MRDLESRVQLKRAVTLLDRGVVMPTIPIDHAQLCIDVERKRVKIASSLHLRYFFLGLADRTEVKSVVLVSCGIVRAQRDTFLKFSFGRSPVPMKCELRNCK